MVVVASFGLFLVVGAITDGEHPFCICLSAVIGHVCERRHGGGFGALCAHKAPGCDQQVGMQELGPRVSVTEALDAI